MLPVGFYLYLLIMDTTGLNQDEAPTTGEEVLSWVYIQLGHAAICLPPALTLTLYLLTGSGGQLGPLIFITMLPNFNLLVHLETALTMWSQMIYISYPRGRLRSLHLLIPNTLGGEKLLEPRLQRYPFHRQ